MSTVVAIVKSIVGQVVAVSPEGIRRVLIEGDRLLAGEQVLTGPSGSVTLELPDGRVLDMGRDSQWSSDAPTSTTNLSEATAQAAPSVAELQQAIAAGADPTQDLEATAAGQAATGTDGGNAGGGHSVVMLTETAGSVTPTIGFPTDGLGATPVATNQLAAATLNNNAAATTTQTASTLSLSATPTLTEAGGALVFTASLTQASQNNVTVNLSNGSNIVIQAGQTSGSVTVQVPDSNTPYIDARTVSTTITGTSGGTDLALTTNNTPAVTNITDTIDTTTVSLTAGSATSTEGTSITYTATLTNPAQTPVTVTLSDGSTIAINAGQTTGSVVVPAPANDVYNTNTTISTTIASATGGNFENLVPSTTPAVVQITDSVDTTTVSLTAGSATSTEGTSITYTATLTNPAQTPVTVTLSDGSTIAINAGQTTGSVVVPAPANDVYNTNTTISTTIAGATGGNFENLVPSTTPAVVQITDSIDTTVASITGTAQVTEGQAATYTVSLSNPAQTEVTVNLTYSGTAADGSDYTQVVSVKIPANASSVTFNLQTIDDTIPEGVENVTVAIGAISGGNFENVAVSATNGSVTTTIVDNDALPVVDPNGNGSGNNSETTFTEGQAGVSIASQLTVTDVDSPTLQGAKVTLTNAQPSDTLLVGSPNANITVTTANTNGQIVLTLSGAATPAEYEAVIKSITFQNGSEDPSIADRNITITVNDGQNDSVSVTSIVHVVAVNDAPVVAIDGNVSFTEGQSGVSLAGQVTLTDVDNDNLQSGKVTLVGTQSGDSLTVGSPNSNITVAQSVVGGDIVLTLTGNATKAEYQAVIDSITFGNSSQNPTTQPREITVSVNDGALDSNVATTSVTVTPVNDAPQIAVTANDVNEGTATTSTAAATFTTQDPDSPTLTVSFTPGTNDQGYYVISGGNVLLTPAGVAQVNAGQTLPKVDLTVSDGQLTGEANATPNVILNAAPEIAVTANELHEGSANTTTVAATFTTKDIDSPQLTVDFTPGTNNQGYYVISGGNVLLTAAGVAQVNAGQALPKVDLTVSDGLKTGEDSATPNVVLNIAPETQATSGSGLEDASQIAVTLHGTDSDGSVKSFVVNTLPANGTLYSDSAMTKVVTAGSSVAVGSDGNATVYFKPTHDWSGDTSFSYKAVDDLGLVSANSATGSITVAPVTDTPTLLLVADRSVVTLEVDGASTGNIETLTNNVWHTDNNGENVEISTPSTYGAGSDTSSNDRVLELERDAGDPANLYTTINAKDGATYTISVDYSPRQGALDNSTINVTWGGVLIGTLSAPATGMQTYTFQVPVTADGAAKLEFKATDSNSFGGVVDNIQVVETLNTGLEDHAILLSTIQAATTDIDGSETLALTLNGLPKGSVLTDGSAAHTVTIGADNSSVDISNWNLSTLKFTPPANTSGNFALTVTATAQDGAADPVSVSAPLIVKVIAVNDAPMLDLDTTAAGTGFADSFTLGHAGVSIANTGTSGVSLTDIDNTTMSKVTVSIANAMNGDALNTTGVTALNNGITASTSGGVITLTGTPTSTLADYQNAIKAITFSTTDTTSATRTINVVADDGSSANNTSTAQTVITIAANATPVIDLDSATGGNNYVTTFTEKGAAVSIAETGVKISDSDNSTVSKVTIVLNGAVTGDTLNTADVAALNNGITAAKDASGVITLTGTSTSTQADYQDAIKAITFSSSSNNPTSADRSVSVTVDDGTGTPTATSTSITTVHVIPVNDVPVAVNDASTPVVGSLQGNYYGYNEGTDGPNLGTIKQALDFIAIHPADAAFSATSLNYGGSDFSNNLGTTTNLSDFLGSDSGSLIYANGSAQPTTSDAIVELTGKVTMAAGDYSLKITADDGYSVYIDGKQVAAVDNNQPSSTQITSFSIATTGAHDLQIVYWDQGVYAQLKVEVAPVSSNGVIGTYSVLGTSAAATLAHDTLATFEDQPLVINQATLLSNDSDADGDKLTINTLQGHDPKAASSVFDAAGNVVGAVTMDANNNVLFTPAKDVNGLVTFSYTVTDGEATSNTATVTVNVMPVNDAPVATANAVTGQEDAAGINVVLKGTDVDTGDTISSFIIKNLPANGTLYSDSAMTNVVTAGSTVAAGTDGTATVYFKPNADWNGSTQFLFNAVDSSGAINNTSTDATATINVAPVNDAPTVSNAFATGNENQAASPGALVFKWSDFGVSDVDSPTSAMGVTINALPTGGVLKYLTSAGWVTMVAADVGKSFTSADIKAGKLEFVSDVDRSGGSDYSAAGVGDQKAVYSQLQFSATDGNATSTPGVMNINIAAIADQPVVTLGTSTVTSTGLVKDMWVGTLKGLSGNGNGASEAMIKSGFNTSTAPTTHAIAAAAVDTNVAVGTGTKLSGLIYLEAGHSYTFSGKGDDSLLITIGGTTAANAAWGTKSGAISSTAYTVTTSGYYTLDIYHYNQNGPGNYNISLVDQTNATSTTAASSTTVALNSSSALLYTSIDDLKASGLSVSALNASAGSTTEGYYVANELNHGVENNAIKLSSIKAIFTDNDGSETHVTTLSGAPAGSVLTDSAGHSVTVVSATTPIDVSAFNLTTLSIKTPEYYNGKFTLTATATATETSNGSSKSASQNIVVTVDQGTYTSTTGHAGTDTALNGSSSNDVMVGDVKGTAIVPGKNYNIAVLLDSSGSMSNTAINNAKAQLTTLFSDLKNTLGSSSGVVNIFLADFDNVVHKSVSVNLADTNAMSKLQAVIDSVSQGGGTNYEDALTQATGFFNSTTATSNVNAQNLTFFLTDGTPTFHLVNGTVSGVNLTYAGTSNSNGGTLSLATAIAEYESHVGTAVTRTSGGVTSTLISENGEVLSYTKSGSTWTANTVGVVHSVDATGHYVYEVLAGTGNTTDSATGTESAAAYAALSKVSSVEAIAVNNNITSSLIAYDTDATPHSSINDGDLASKIGSSTTALAPGNDVINGGDGNDILFGDLISYGNQEGTAALKAFAADTLHVNVSTITDNALHQFVTSHIGEVTAQANSSNSTGLADGNDTLIGGNGDDILFGQGGNDILVGGKGNDILIGGAGADTFVWKQGDYGSDVVKDFSTKQGDKLDLSDLLQNEDGSDATALAKFLQITNDGKDTIVQVSTTGQFTTNTTATAAANTADVHIKLENVTWNNDMLKSLVQGADPTIKVDHH
jgi:surface adhesion protein